MRYMWLRTGTTLALAAIAFYAGVLAGDARSTAFEVPTSADTIPVVGSGRVSTSVTATYSIETHPSRLVAAAAIAALVAAAFLVVRLAIAVVRRVRLRAA